MPDLPCGQTARSESSKGRGELAATGDRLGISPIRTAAGRRNVEVNPIPVAAYNEGAATDQAVGLGEPAALGPAGPCTREPS